MKRKRARDTQGMTCADAARAKSRTVKLKAYDLENVLRRVDELVCTVRTVKHADVHGPRASTVHALMLGGIEAELSLASEGLRAMLLPNVPSSDIPF